MTRDLPQYRTTPMQQIERLIRRRVAQYFARKNMPGRAKTFYAQHHRSLLSDVTANAGGCCTGIWWGDADTQKAYVDKTWKIRISQIGHACPDNLLDWYVRKGPPVTLETMERDYVNHWA